MGSFLEKGALEAGKWIINTVGTQRGDSEAGGRGCPQGAGRAWHGVARPGAAP